MNGLDPPSHRSNGLPLRVTGNDTSRWQHLLPLQQVQDDALHWITEHRDHTIVAHSLLALPTITTRFSNLACLLTRHFRSMAESNPARALRATLFGNVQRLRDRILPKCYFHDDFKLWKADQRRLEQGLLSPLPGGLTPESLNYPLKLWLRNKFFAD
ncbi:hypothetical protein BGZ74_005120, partial [Mortierella antarctica]